MLVYITKSYKNLRSAAGKAKTDIEDIIADMGARNLGIGRTMVENKIGNFILTLAGTLKGLSSIRKGDVLVVQYPFKKYYSLVCKVAHSRGAKVITQIHDLGSFRRKKLTVSQEIAKLSLSDIVIAHTPAMKDWLLKHGFEKPVVVREVFDYLGGEAGSHPQYDGERIRVLFAGDVSFRMNSFLYDLAIKNPSLEIILFGSGFSKPHASENMTDNGFTPSDKLIEKADADFGLIWYGRSVFDSVGRVGNYVGLIAPHKLSLYLRCGLPVIVGSNSGMAGFVTDNNIGIAVDSLDNLGATLASISPEQRATMKENARMIGRRLADGYYTRKAIDEAVSLLSE